MRWVDGFARVNELAERLSETRLTYIADREGDIYDLFVEAPCPDQGADWLVRVQHGDRLLSDGRTLRAALEAAPVLTEIRFDRPPAKGRSARTVDQQLKVVCVTLKAPARADRTLVDVTVTALLATEPNPPAGEDPLEQGETVLTLTDQQLRDLPSILDNSLRLVQTARHCWLAR